MTGRLKGLFLIVILALIGLALFVLPGRAQKPNADKAKPPRTARLVPIIGHAVGFAETKPARELAAPAALIDAQFRGEARELNERNTRFVRRPKPNAPPQKDGALQSSWVRIPSTPNIPAPLLTFEGVAENGGSPPDTTGAVGPNDYVQTVNVLVRIFDKNGVPRGPAFTMSSLFAAIGGICANSDAGDPIVLYDRISNRWLLSQFAFTGGGDTPPFHQCIAISKTGDPTGAYWAYDFETPGKEFPDYPKFGAWPDGYYYTDRQFTNGVDYNGFGCIAFERAKMLVGDPTASYIYFNAGPDLSNSSSDMLPTDFNGLTPPPPGAPNLFSVFIDDVFDDADALRLFDFHADFANPENSTFTERPESPLAVAAFDSRSPHTQSAGSNEIEQPPPATAADYLDSLSSFLMLRLQYINRGGTEMVTTVHTVNGGIIPPDPNVDPTVAEYKAATRYYILQKTTPGGAWSVLDQATFSPDTNERWTGSSALDNAGNLAVGYSVSSLTTFPSIFYAGRLATDPPNTLSGEQTMFAGTGVQRQTQDRWGDYSNMSVDPSDDATFWYTNEYYVTSGAGLWHTRVGKFKFADTVAPPQGTLAGTITACDTGARIKDALVEVSGGPSTGFSSATAANGSYSMKLSPGSYSVTISDPAHLCTAIGPFNVTINNGATTTQNRCLRGAPKLLFQSSVVLGGNGNGIIETNECNNLNVTILNDGCARALNVSAVLSSSTPEVTITQPNSTYPVILENAAKANTIPFGVSTSNAFACGTTIDFTLTVTSNGETIAIPFSIPTCIVPPTTINGALTAGDPQEEARIGRDGQASICGSPKDCPGPLGSGPRLYDLHSFTNGPADACVTIQTTPSCSDATNPILTVAYLSSFDPSDLCTNYIGDAGGSPATGLGNSFSVDVPANATLLVNVQEINPGLVGCSGYAVTVSGLVGNGSGNAPCPAAPSVVSRKTHGSPRVVGTFSIPMPLTGPSGVEDRIGNGGVAGNHTIVLSYTTSPVGVTASVAAHNPSAGTGNVSGVSVSGNDLIVNLSGVSNQQVLTLATSGGSVTPVTVPIGFLLGDTNGDRSVSASDVSQTSGQVGVPVSGANFRTDTNVSGSINSSDVTQVSGQLGTSLP